MALPHPTVLAAPAGYARWSAAGHRLLLDAGVDVVENPHDRPLTRVELRDYAPRISAAVVGVEIWDASIMDLAPGLRVLAKQGVGLDNIDLEAARDRGIAVVNVPGGNANAVAEFGVGLMLAALRGLADSAQSVRRGEWARTTGLELAGRTVGLVGFGTIGRLVARRLSGFDVTLLAWDPYPNTEAAADLAVRLAELDEVLAASDVVSLHMPLLPETHGFVDAGFLGQMRAGSFLVNTARGGLVDEQALVAALKSGHLQGAALDVFSIEPLPSEHPLRSLPGVVATGHIGADTVEAYNAISVANARSIIEVLKGTGR